MLLFRYLLRPKPGLYFCPQVPSVTPTDNSPVIVEANEADKLEAAAEALIAEGLHHRQLVHIFCGVT